MGSSSREAQVRLIGTEKKSEIARRLKAARVAGYRFATGHRTSGSRFLTEDEVDRWFKVVDGHRRRVIGPAARMKGKR